MDELKQNVPSAYRVVEMAGRFYPLRFGMFRLDAQRHHISFGRLEDAEAYCWNEQRDYEQTHPSKADR